MIARGRKFVPPPSGANTGCVKETGSSGASTAAGAALASVGTGTIDSSVGPTCATGVSGLAGRHITNVGCARLTGRGADTARTLCTILRGRKAAATTGLGVVATLGASLGAILAGAAAMKPLGLAVGLGRRRTTALCFTGVSTGRH